VQPSATNLGLELTGVPSFPDSIQSGVNPVDTSRSVSYASHEYSRNTSHAIAPDRLKMLQALEKKVLWLSAWIVHHANHIRPKPDGLKVGGHQASSASVVTLMTALYFDILRAEDRVAVKPHASPVFHAIQYLLGRQTRENLERFRALGGAQAYPSRTKDADEVDISTGSVGLGVAMTVFSSLVQDYLDQKGLLDAYHPPGRKVAIVGDAELDEGNVFEALFEGWKHDLRNVWWVIDYNRQSLDLVVEDQLVHRLQQMFRTVDWNIVVLKYGRKLQDAFAQPGGDALRHWIDNCPNSLYSALVYQGGANWRQQLHRDLGTTAGMPALLDQFDDADLHSLMTNLGGHDLESVLDAFGRIQDDQPTAIVAYTIKGYGLPMAGHKDNHAGLMSPQQVEQLRESMQIPAGREWEPFTGLNIPEERIESFIADVPFGKVGRRNYKAARVTVPNDLRLAVSEKLSTQGAFGRLLNEFARQHDPSVDRIVTMSPDVASSTNLGPWITKRGIFDRRSRPNVFAEQQVSSSLPWSIGPKGQHIELGITETNLFLLLAACGLAADHHGQRLLPIGTLYDPFISRGLDALNYACYQDARFIVIGTPSGVSLAPEGGAHQSVYTPMIGIGQPGLTYFEPAYADEVREMLLWAFDHLQADNGGSVYLRLSTRKVEQPERVMSPETRQSILNGAYWLVPPQKETTHAIVAMGAVVVEAIAAQRELTKQGSAPALLVVTSPDRLARGWCTPSAKGNGAEPGDLLRKLFVDLPPRSTLVTVLDGHPLSLAWLGSVTGCCVVPLGVSKFGMSGYLSEVYCEHHLDAAAIVEAVSNDQAAKSTVSRPSSARRPKVIS
jgi:pyruvate dehydrogenase E1 component